MFQTRRTITGLLYLQLLFQIRHCSTPLQRQQTKRMNISWPRKRQTDRGMDAQTVAAIQKLFVSNRNATAGVGRVSTVAGTLPGSCSSCQRLGDKCGTDRLGEHDPCTFRLQSPIHTPISSKWLQCYYSCKYMHLVQWLLKDTCPELNRWRKLPDTTTNPVKQQQYKPEHLWERCRMGVLETYQEKKQLCI